MKNNKQPAVYILASHKYGTLYIGVTSDLVNRVWQHKNDIMGGFTETYKVHLLVYFELHDHEGGNSTRKGNQAMETFLEGPFD